MSSYSLAEVARICRVQPSRLRRWQRMALLRPEPARAKPRAFEFRDLVSVRRLRGLLERGVPMQQIRRGVQALRARHPELARPVEALAVWSVGAPRVVVREEGVLGEPDGQLVLDFADGVDGGHVAVLVRRPAEGTPGEPPLAIRDAAEEWFEVGCRLDSDRGSYGEAIEAYLRALAVDPGHADSHCNLGSIYYNQGRRAPARACFERALAADSGHVEANLNLATMLEEEDRNDLALRHYQRALASDPLYADAHVSVALVYEKLGLPRRARDHWRRYLQIDPGGSWADVARRHLES